MQKSIGSNGTTGGTLTGIMLLMLAFTATGTTLFRPAMSSLFTEKVSLPLVELLMAHDEKDIQP